MFQLQMHNFILNILFWSSYAMFYAHGYQPKRLGKPPLFDIYPLTGTA